MNGCKTLVPWMVCLAAACSAAKKDDDSGDLLPGAGANGLPLAGQAAGAAGVGASAGTGVPQAGASAGTSALPTAGMISAGMGGMAGTDMMAGTGGVPEPACPTCTIPPECQGFPLEGIQYSPGGTVLPNKCEPYHPTTNNPYAVRCIDAMPEYDTGFPGDEYCILPPPPELGIQVGVHPHGTTQAYWEELWAGDYSTYQNPDPTFVMEGGSEKTENYLGSANNAEEVIYYRTYFRMRTGSHHNIITMHEGGGMADGWIPGVGDALPGLFDSSAGMLLGVLGGQQRPDDSTPVSLEAPPEDDGLYLTFPANSKLIFNMHHFNTTDGPVLREGWANIWKTEARTTPASWYMGLSASNLLLYETPESVADFHYMWPISADTRLIRVFGHRHFWTTNFSAWVERASGETELLYQSYDWEDMPTYRYDSVQQNPPLNPEGRTDGAVSGVTMLRAGDELHFNCHVEFTEERAASDSTAPSPASLGQLVFANQAFEGEMCIQFGNISGPRLGLPGAATTPVPDFAKVSR